MSSVGQREIKTQQRVITFLRDALGYAYLGHWKDRETNSNIEEQRLTDWLRQRGHDDQLINRTLFELNKAAALGGSKTLYDANREVYGLLRYGVKVRPEVGEQTVTVWLVDWEHPGNNDFAVAEEMTVYGVHTKQPDLVLYVNGIALGVLELKRSIVPVSEGSRRKPCVPARSKRTESVGRDVPAQPLLPTHCCCARPRTPPRSWRPSAASAPVAWRGR